MRFTIKTKIRILCGVFLLIFIPSTLFLLANLTHIIAAFKEVVQIAEQTIVESQGLAKLIVDMETGERGFVITGEEEFLEPYHRANEAFDKSLQVLRAGLLDQSYYLQLLEQIEHLRYKWMGVAGEPEIEARRLIKRTEVSLKTIFEMSSKENGDNLLDRMRMTIKTMSDELRRAGRKDELILITQISKDAVDAETGEKGFLLAGKERFLESYYAAQVAFSKHVKELALILTDDNTNLGRLYQIESLFDQWLVEAAGPEINIRIQYEHNPRTMDDVIGLLKAGTGKKIIDELRTVIQEFTDGLTKDIQQELFLAEKRATLVNFISLGISSASILLSVFIAFVLGRSIINPIKLLTEGTKKIAEGNLMHKIAVNTRDEFEILSESFNRMTEDLRKSNDELIESIDYTDNIIKSMVDSLIIVDPELKITMVNKATCDLLEYDAEELIGKDIDLLFSRQEGSAEEQKMFQGNRIKELVEGGIIKGVERTYVTKTEKRIPTLFSGSVMHDKAGRIRGIICLASDISKLKQAEEAYRIRIDCESEANHNLIL